MNEINWGVLNERYYHELRIKQKKPHKEALRIICEHEQKIKKKKLLKNKIDFSDKEIKFLESFFENGNKNQKLLLNWL